MTRRWTEAYYDTVEGYFWTSGKLGHKPDPDRKHKKPADIFKRLRRLEEPLNDLLGFFFSLAPPSFVANLFRQFAQIDVDEPLTFLGRDVQRLGVVDGATQPDFAFDAPSCFLTLEAKIDSKSSLEQLAKYALLHQRMQAKRARKEHGLLYLSKNGPKGLFPGGLVGWDLIKKRTIAALPTIDKWTFRKMNDASRAELATALGWLRVASMQYRDLELALRQESSSVKGDGDAGGVVRRLYEGLADELKDRGLT